MNIRDAYRDSNRVSRKDLAEAIEDDLLELKVLVDDEIGHIAEQLTEAKAKAASTGDYSDADWYRRATSAKRIKGRLSQRIQNELARRKRARIESNAHQQREGKLHFLLEAMNQVLTPEQKEKVLDLWRELKA